MANRASPRADMPTADSPPNARCQALRFTCPTQGRNDRRKTSNIPAGGIHGITRGLNTIFMEREYPPGGGAGANSSSGGRGGGCRIGSLETDDGGGGGGGGGGSGAM